MIRDDDKRVSVAACQALLDRGYGKPMQPTEQDIRITQPSKTIDEIEAELREAANDPMIKALLQRIQ